MIGAFVRRTIVTTGVIVVSVWIVREVYDGYVAPLRQLREQRSRRRTNPWHHNGRFQPLGYQEVPR
jgi:hypothetical protein